MTDTTFKYQTQRHWLGLSSPFTIKNRLQASILASAISLSLFSSTQASTINVIGTCTLGAAIAAANANAPIFSCTAGQLVGTDTIVLQNSSIHSLTTSLATGGAQDGRSGLPSITSNISIEGNGATIRRAAISQFRLFHVSNSGNLRLDNVHLSNGAATDLSTDYGNRGGAIFNDGFMTIIDSTISDNLGGSGGGIYNKTGDALLVNTTVSNNSATANGGGGMYNETSSVRLIKSTVSNNNADSSGGGMKNYKGTVTLVDSTVSGNEAASKGGGLWNIDNITTLNSSTVSGNTAAFGGGINNQENNAFLNNSTISSNIAITSGAGMYNESANVTLRNSTISSNSAVAGGGLYNESSSVYFHNSLLANNLAAGEINQDCKNQLSLIFNEVGNWAQDATCFGGGYAEGDPKLGPLKNNGGPTQTHALLTGSGAIDGGSDAVCANPATINNLDQRGMSRKAGAHCDTGAFEFQDSSFFVIPFPDGKVVIFSL